MAAPEVLTRNDFHQLARLNLRAARRLLTGGHWTNAYHVAGYAVEFGLKACIAKRTRKNTFPPKETKDLYTHELARLLAAARLDPPEKAGSKALNVNWTTVKDWNPESRYDLSITEKKAKDLYSAITAKQNGVMRWVRARW